MLTLKNIKKDLEEYIKSNKTEPMEFQNHGKEPGAVLEQNEDIVDIIKLERDIRMLRNSEYVFRVVAFVYNLNCHNRMFFKIVS